MALRVLQVFEYPTINGGENSLLSMVKRIPCDQFEVIAAGPDRGKLAERLSRDSIQLCPLSLHNANSGRLDIELCRERLQAVIQSQHFDIVHANSLSMSRLLGPVSRDLGIPSVGHIRDIVKLSRRAIADVNMQNRLLAVSSATRDFHVAAGLDPSIVEVLYNGIDLTRFCCGHSTGNLQQQLGLPAEAPLIVSIGQIVLRKGLDVWLDIAQEVAVHRPHVHFVHVGSRFSRKAEAIAHEQQVLERSRSGVLSGRVHFLGQHDDIPALLNDSTLLLHTARQEPLGRVLLEAAACSLPVVASRVGGTTEIFPHADQARLFDITRPSDAVEAILKLLESKSLRTDLGAAARRRVEERFDVVQQALALLRHYYGLVP